MTAERSGPVWDFTPILDLLHALSSPPRHDELPIDTAVDPSPIPPISTFDPGKPPSLGNFDAVFKYLGKPINIENVQSLVQTCDEVPSLSDSYSSSLSSNSTQAAEHFDDFIKTKAVRWDDDVDVDDIEEVDVERSDNVSLIVNQDWKHLNLHLLENLLAADDDHFGTRLSQRTIKTILPAQKDKRLRAQQTSSSVNFSDIESDGERLGSFLASTNDYQGGKNFIHQNDYKSQFKHKLPSAAHLTPAWVTPSLEAANLPPTSVSDGLLLRSPTSHPVSISISATEIRAKLCLTLEEKISQIIKKLIKTYGSDKSSILNIGISRVVSSESRDGLHVFVDSSNIFIGFQTYLKKTRGINKNAYTRRPPFSFHSLALIMERGRTVARRILVGSSRSNVRPDYMVEAVQCGYQVSSLEQVEKYKEIQTSGKRRNRGGYGTSGPSSGSETQSPGRKFVTEQGVDEILHMKMLESIVDSKQPSTMVLATGDAAEAEYSDGFLKNVERALEKGWKVELVTWSDSMSYAYQSVEFLNKWKNKFSIVRLDDFSEELLALYVPTYSKSYTEVTL